MTPLETLRALGTGGEPPAGTKERVAGALFAIIDAASVASGATIPRHSLGPNVPPAMAPFLGGVAGSKVMAVAASIWLLGGITGAAIYRAWCPRELHVVYVDRPVAPTSPQERPALPAVAAPSAAPIPLSSAAVSPVPERPSGGTVFERGSELARERALLDLARSAAGHGEPERVLAIVAQHRQQFARGRLSEEREALAIRALLSLGRGGEARERARAFRDIYPNSFLIPALESALSGP